MIPNSIEFRILGHFANVRSIHFEYEIREITNVQSIFVNNTIVRTAHLL